nr:D(3) dopamine receptor [Paramormyrops kingsleyae]
MSLFAATGAFWNKSDTLNGTGVQQEEGRNYSALLYALLILVVVFGNSLVCLAVLRERALQTSTNYLVVSLAVADLLVAILVMPWVVYLEVLGGDWPFSRLSCNIFVTLDVMMCTASILNLCAISIDRYLAVVMPVLYTASRKSRGRVSAMIATVWILAFAVSCPLLFGFNTTDKASTCSISNPEFVVYSSVVSFYLPFVVTLLVYMRIYVFFKRRRRRRRMTSCGASVRVQEESVTEREASSIEIKVARRTRRRPQALCGPHFPSTCLLHWKFKSPTVEDRRAAESADSYNVSQASLPRLDIELQQREAQEESLAAESKKEAAKRRQGVKNLPNGQTLVSLHTAHRGGNMQTREKKATQMLAIVLGVFLICWLPFFVTHILKTHCKGCHVPNQLYSAATWLGYVNSAVNPIIYTTFNVDFRRAFIKILSC